MTGLELDGVRQTEELQVWHTRALYPLKQTLHSLKRDLHLLEAEDTMTNLRLDGTADRRIASVAETNRGHSREPYIFLKEMYTPSKELYILTKETYVLYKYPLIGLQLDGAQQTWDLQVRLKEPVAL